MSDSKALDISLDVSDGAYFNMQNQYNEAIALEAEGQNPYPSSSYVGGVKATLAWLLGDSEEPPLEVK